ncbi:hypothetical protein DYB26_008488 [Aphanomyces astaci]|uniref:RING-type domain-containing protein n=1 Tax=Aphanomyces astaci TaxID=112090 RepID=A0A397FND4_APHAT|nr:hypothetical protein DYB26_008488 [Aphanomyces astaci]RHZ32798.1 hypothetical protein DYB31_009299 [Aphanomyces astaci]
MPSYRNLAVLSPAARRGSATDAPAAGVEGLPIEDDDMGQSTNQDDTSVVAAETVVDGGPTRERRPSIRPTALPPPLEKTTADAANPQANLKARIMQIQTNKSLTPKEKADGMQKVMMQQWTEAQERLTPKQAESKPETPVADSDRTVVTYHNADAGIKGCSHYQYVAFHLDHGPANPVLVGENANYEQEKHAFDRYATEKISCMECHTIQPVGPKCINDGCGVDFARYYCSECKFYDDDETKDIYHCEKCRICRIGKGLGVDYFHCDKCNACMSITLKKHKCVERSLESDCPICHVYMFTSTTPVMFLPCGHCMHVACYEDYTQDYRSQIYCSDCERKSETKFHFVYHKCQHDECKSYNTKVVKHFKQEGGSLHPPPAPAAVRFMVGRVVAVHLMKMWHSFVSYMASHFYALKMRPVSGFDPSGFMFMLAFVCLVVGLLLAVFDKRSQRRLSTYLDNKKLTRLSTVGKLVASTAIDHSARQGFIAEMLSFNYLSRLSFSIFVFGITSYLNALAAVVAGWRTPNVVILTMAKDDSGEKTLPDLGHDLFKAVMTLLYGDTDYIDWFDLPDEFIAFVGSIIAVLFLVHPRRLLILRRFTMIYAWINFLRAFCVAVTSLPDASPMCISQFDSRKGAYKSLPIFPKAFHRAFKVLIRPSHHITCGDMIFSGHTVFLVLCALTVTTAELNTPFTRAHPWVLTLVKTATVIGSTLGAFAIVGTRLHYTLDVLIAIYVTIQTWYTYHWLSEDNRWGIRIISWLEHDRRVVSIDHNAYRMARRSGSFNSLNKQE